METLEGATPASLAAPPIEAMEIWMSPGQVQWEWHTNGRSTQCMVCR